MPYRRPPRAHAPDHVPPRPGGVPGAGPLPQPSPHLFDGAALPHRHVSCQLNDRRQQLLAAGGRLRLRPPRARRPLRCARATAARR
jgi:hypothetical protein